MPDRGIRPARAADLQELAGLERVAFVEPWSESQIRGQLESSASVLLVEDDASGRVTGYAAFLVVADEAELLRIAVLPAARRSGVARRLLEEGLRRIAARGVGRCFLEVSSANAPARALYLLHGFTEVGRRSAYYADGHDALLLRIDLSRS